MEKILCYIFNEEYFICLLNRLKLINEYDENDLIAIKTLNNPDFKNELLKNENNYYLLREFEDPDNKKILISNIKCFRNPTLISYEYEHYKSLF
ncbi:hypothetical protein [Methanosphaera sp. BMS]|uniref:hypothetical protein n=1 Tax=Methanosphaera sp. BMS TaxID=1789762 RepID=UPI000DC1F1F0|nr:hypothetical protein [Methanosphaera sp. BMS]AWX31603.1 hypothetical protein AW729_00235 [Methanosphaera sp. BMS]